jgi:hypothetical protein
MTEVPEPDAGEASGSPEQGAAEAPTDDAQEMRRRYREALERKRGRDSGTAAGRRSDGSGGVGPSSGGRSQRMFRRKSG